MNYYERHIGDYLKDTAHLSLLEHGIYTRLLDVYYTREAGLDPADVGRLIGARSRDEKSALQVVLSEFFKLVDGLCVQGRCDREIERFQDKQRKAKASADARWSQSGRNANASKEQTADAMRTHSEGNAPSLQTPVTSNQTPDTKNEKRASAPSRPVDVPEQTWVDWLALRRAKKAPVTETVVAEARREAQKAGMVFSDFLAEWCGRGSQGLKADWIVKATTPGARPVNRALAIEAENARVLAETLAGEPR